MQLETFIPQIWADQIIKSLVKQITLGWAWSREDVKRHKRRMKTDPAYRKAYKLWIAELEAESYWTALYSNQVDEEEEDFDY